MTVPNPQGLEVKEVGDATHIRFVDITTLDDKHIRDIGAGLFALVEQLGPRRIFFDLGNIVYLSSAGLDTFIMLYKKINDSGGEMILCNVNPTLMEVFEVTKLTKVFTIQRSQS